MLFGRPDKELDEDNKCIDSNNCTIGHCSETKFMVSNEVKIVWEIEPDPSKEFISIVWT